MENIEQKNSIISRYFKGRVVDILNIGCKKKESSMILIEYQRNGVVIY